MKVSTELFPVRAEKDIKAFEKNPAKSKNQSKIEKQHDSVTLSTNSFNIVTSENKAAANIEINDFKQAVKEVSYFKRALEKGESNSIPIHQLNGERVLALLFD